MRLLPASLLVPLALGLTTALSRPLWADADDDSATTLFAAAFQGACDGAFAEDGSLFEPPQRHDLTVPSSWSDTPAAVTIWQFRCFMGAYNINDVFLVRTEANGIMPAYLSRPEILVENEIEGDSDSPVRAITVVGFSAGPFAVNPEFDPATGILTENAYWRGMGDASSQGRWRLSDDGFVLLGYDVDASYDGEINPMQVIALD